MEQKILIASENYIELDSYFRENNIRKVLLVCGKSIYALKVNQYFNTLEKRQNVKVIRFTDFQPNPSYDSVVKGVSFFRENHCDSIIAVGGGSAIDVAKCIKLFSNMNIDKNYLEQEIIPNNIKLLAVPTTAGSGSEATKYAVIYYNGEKQSITHQSCIPETVLIDMTVLKSLPEYQKKATMMDAFCHAIESFWSINSTNESKAYSRKAIQMILANKELYLSNEDVGNANMFQAANIAGKAINITQTTAGHAMCYKLTSLYGISHGHAAAICVSELWPYMLEHLDECIDPRGSIYLKSIFMEIAEMLGCETIETGISAFRKFVNELGLVAPTPNSMQEFDILKASVNPVRIKNNPVNLDTKAIEILYHRILNCLG